MPAPAPHFVRVDSMAGERPIRGVDADGAGGLWIVYRDPTADVRVVHLDADHHPISEWLYQDESALPSGLAYTGDAVWINYGFGHDHVRKLDATTGATLARFETEGEITDLAAGPDHQLLLASAQNAVVTIDRDSGGELARTRIAAPFIDSTQRGVAYVGGELWVTSWMTDDIYMATRDGTIAETGSTDVTRQHVAAEDVYIAWDGAQLILATENEIWWLGE
jgi:hypothetical protein